MKTNKYHKWYDQLIDRARNRTIEGYVERHHIVPRSLGGTDEKSNLVKLTAREHLIAHMLLPRFVENKAPMWNALWYMMCINKDRVICNARVYEQARIESTRIMAAKKRGKKLSPESIAKRTATQAANRAANAAKGIFYKPSPETCAKISALKRGSKHSLETIAKMKGRRHTPDARARISATLKGFKHSPETITKRAATRVANNAVKRANGISIKWSPESIAKGRATRAAKQSLKLSRLNQLPEESDVGIRESGVPL